MSWFGVKIVIKNSDHKLQFCGKWGDGWEEDPTDLQPGEEKVFNFKSNNRGGIWYRVLDKNSDEELGFVNMSFTCPKLSNNSAEGTHEDGIFINAGLQTYEASGHPVEIVYRIGKENEASWDDSSAKSNDIVCSQTNFKDTRARIIIENPDGYDLKFGNFWNDGGEDGSKWYWSINQNDIPPPLTRRTVFLKDNDRAGIFLKVLSSDGLNELGFANMLFTNPHNSGNSAEGSPKASYLVSAGLQQYKESGTPVDFTYKIGQENLASWSDGNENDGKIECEQTTFSDRRALIIVKNTLPVTLKFEKYWNNNESGGKEKYWYVEPDGSDSIPGNCERYFVLKDNNRAGLFFEIDNLQHYHLSFTAPEISTNSAEGSSETGLQTYSEHGVPVTFTYNIGTPNLASWTSGDYNTGEIECPETKTSEIADCWMGKLNSAENRFGANMALKDIFIPGTHDSACYSFQGIESPIVRTQELNFQQQLEKGARYFDLRPIWTSQEGEKYHGFHHGIVTVTPTLDDLIEQVTAFYTDAQKKDERKQEVLILDFTHFENYEQEEYQNFIDTLSSSSLKNYLIPSGTSTNSLRDLWSSLPDGGRIIASVNFDPSSYSNSNNIWRGSDLFESGWDGTRFWPDTNKPGIMINFLTNIINNSTNYTKLWALQDILTPQPPNNYSVKNLAPKAHSALYNPVRYETWKSKVNIVIQDYYDDLITIAAITENYSRAKISKK